MAAIEQGRQLDTNSLYKDEIDDKGTNVELSLMEKGRIAQLQGNYTASMSSYKKEISILRQREIYDDTLPEAQITIGSVLVNDNLLEYRARLFEIEMVYLYQSYNYLGKGSLEGALVEIRRAEFLLNEAEKARHNEQFDDAYYRNAEAGIQKKLFKTQDTALPPAIKSNQIDSSKNTATNSDEQEQQPYKENVKSSTYKHLIQKASNESFTEMKTLLDKTKNSFLNPYVVYVGGLIHELNKEFSDSYISYKKALMLMPLNPYLQQDVIRLAIKINRTDEIGSLKSKYPESWKQVVSNKSSTNEGRLVIIYEDGWIERKKETKISLGAFAIAYPVYKFNWVEPKPLQVKFGKGSVEETSPICYMSSLILRALKEEEKWRVIRQTARATVKGGVFAAGTTAMAVSSNSNVQLAGMLVMIFSGIYNNVTENADLRCWMTLPENIQILTTSLPEGKNKIILSTNDSNIKLEKNITIKKSDTTILWVIRVGSRLIYEQLWPNYKNIE